MAWKRVFLRGRQMLIRDGDWTLVDSDLKLGRFVWSMQNPDGSTTYRTDYSVDPTVEANTAMRNMASKGWTGDYHKVASIPLALVHGDGYLAQAVKANDDVAMSKWLNDGDNRAWRTKDGRL